MYGSGVPIASSERGALIRNLSSRSSAPDSRWCRSEHLSPVSCSTLVTRWSLGRRSGRSRRRRRVVDHRPQLQRRALEASDVRSRHSARSYELAQRRDELAVESRRSPARGRGRTSSARLGHHRSYTGRSPVLLRERQRIHLVEAMMYALLTRRRSARTRRESMTGLGVRLTQSIRP